MMSKKSGSNNRFSVKGKTEWCSVFCAVKTWS